MECQSVHPIMRAESREPRAESREPRAESREPRAESREPRAESRTSGLNLQFAPPEQPSTALHPSDLPHSPARRPGWCDAMRREHHRRYQGRFTRLAILARSLTAPAAAGLLLALAALLVITPAQGNAQSATYRVTFEGKFTASALASGVSVPSGEHFTTLIGAVHNGSVTFWSSGGTASAGVEGVAELGNTGTFKSEINANMNAVAVIEQSIASGGTATATVDIVVTTDHPRVTLLSMVAPSPDWFVGVSRAVFARCAGRLAGRRTR